MNIKKASLVKSLREWIPVTACLLGLDNKVFQLSVGPFLKVDNKQHFLMSC